MRNCLIAAGNAGDDRLIPVLKLIFFIMIRACGRCGLGIILLSGWGCAWHASSRRGEDVDVQAEWKTALNLAD